MGYPGRRRRCIRLTLIINLSSEIYQKLKWSSKPFWWARDTYGVVTRP